MKPERPRFKCHLSTSSLCRQMSSQLQNGVRHTLRSPENMAAWAWEARTALRTWDVREVGSESLPIPQHLL